MSVGDCLRDNAFLDAWLEAQAKANTPPKK
jgi:hypothetical protein